MATRFQAETERASTVRTCQLMYKTDPRAKGVLRTLARDTMKGGYRLVVSEGLQAEKAQEVADALEKRVKLNKLLRDWVLLSARDGDSFIELGITADGLIAELTRKPSLQMRRNSNDFDRFDDPAHAFVWSDEALFVTGDVVYFPYFLMVQARWDYDGDGRYGTPEFASANGVWKKVTEGELDIAIRRKTRAGQKYVHKLIGATPADLESYKTENQDALDNPFAAVADFFINFDGGIEVVGGDAQLAEIGDVEHHIQTWSASSPVPLELVAYGSNLNRDVLGEKKAQYDETLDDVRAWTADELIKPIVERQWLLAGILPESLTYEVQWATKRNLTPADMQAVAEAALRFRVLGWPDEKIWQVLSQFLPDGVNTNELAADDLGRLMTAADEAKRGW